MREQIDRVKNWKQFLNEKINFRWAKHRVSSFPRRGSLSYNIVKQGCISKSQGRGTNFVKLLALSLSNPELVEWLALSLSNPELVEGLLAFIKP